MMHHLFEKSTKDSRSNSIEFKAEFAQRTGITTVVVLCPWAGWIFDIGYPGWIFDIGYPGWIFDIGYPGW